MPLANLQPAAMSIPSLLQPAKARQSGVVVVEDSDSEHPALAMEPDGENMLSIVPKAQAQLVQPAPGEDFIFGGHQLPVVDCALSKFKDSVFFSITGDSMKHHTVVGDRPQNFDVFAQRYRFCFGDDSQVHVTAFAAPVALDFAKLEFDMLTNHLVVWSMDHSTVGSFTSISTMKLACAYIFVLFFMFFIVIVGNWEALDLLHRFVYFVPRSQMAGNALLDMMHHGAVYGKQSGVYMCDVDDPAITELRGLGFVDFAGNSGDGLVVTKEGVMAVQFIPKFHLPTPVLEYVSNPQPEEAHMTAIDLLLALLSDGWQDKLVATKAKHAPYTTGSAKIILVYARSAISCLYLRALLNSNAIFAKNIAAIHHHQSEAYYRTLLECTPDQAHQVQPNLTLKNYKSILKGTVEESLKSLNRQSSDDEGDLLNKKKAYIVEWTTPLF